MRIVSREYQMEQQEPATLSIRGVEPRPVITYIFLSGWVIWSVLSCILLVSSESSIPLLCAYELYCVLVTVILVLARKDIFSPPAIFSIIAFVTFGANIPLIASGYFHGLSISDASIRIGNATLTKVMIVLLCSKVAFMCGYVTRLHKLIPTHWIVRCSRPCREAGYLLFVILGIWVITAGLTRMHFHLGEAGIQSGIPLTGLIQYTLYEGTLILCLWFLAQGLVKGKLFMLLALLLLFGMAVIQALQGWRGSIIQVFVTALVPFWYQKEMYHKHKVQSVIWLLVLVVFMSSLIQLGQAVRVQRLGAQKLTEENLVDLILLRSQGTTRLAAVVDHFGHLSMTNNWLIFKLISEGLTTTQYIDRKLYHIAAKRSHSVGTSGPGGPYTAMGLLGVLACYGLLGAFYRSCYNNISRNGSGFPKPWGIVLYSLLVYLLIITLSENFNVGTAKQLIAITGQIFVYKYILLQRVPAANSGEPLSQIAGQVRVG